MPLAKNLLLKYRKNNVKCLDERNWKQLKDNNEIQKGNENNEK